MTDRRSGRTAVVGRRLRRGLLIRVLRTPRGTIGAALVLVVVLAGLFAGTLAPGDPFDTSGPALAAPSARHPLGTDHLGRDMYRSIVHGAATTMTVVGSVVALSTLLGLAVGSVAGFRGGVVDDVLMRLAELFQVVPRFFLALLVIAFYGAGLDRLILLLGLTSWPFLSRVVRAEVLALREQEFVEAAIAIGARPVRVVVRHLFPCLMPAVLVVVALFASRVILIEAGLSFLGLGDPHRVSWGSLANAAQQYMQLAWWTAVFPGAAIAVAVLGLNLLADGINDAIGREA